MGTTVVINYYDLETGETTEERTVSAWQVKQQEGQPDSGVYIGFDEGIGITVTEDELAAMGYYPA